MVCSVLCVCTRVYGPGGQARLNLSGTLEDRRRGWKINSRAYKDMCLRGRHTFARRAASLNSCLYMSLNSLSIQSLFVADLKPLQEVAS